MYAFSFLKKYDISLLSIKCRVLDRWRVLHRCRALDRLACVDAHLWLKPDPDPLLYLLHKRVKPLKGILSSLVIPNWVKQLTSPEQRLPSFCLYLIGLTDSLYLASSLLSYGCT
jgi:hypothetical protein